MQTVHQTNHIQCKVRLKEWERISKKLFPVIYHSQTNLYPSASKYRYLSNDLDYYVLTVEQNLKSEIDNFIILICNKKIHFKIP